MVTEVCMYGDYYERANPKILFINYVQISEREN